jgi:hypothetical protein
VQRSLCELIVEKNILLISFVLQKKNFLGAKVYYYYVSKFFLLSHQKVSFYLIYEL